KFVFFDKSAIQVQIRQSSIYIQPGKPTQNAYVERKNGSMRRELLNVWLFNSLNEARSKIEDWRIDYNQERPHKALNYLSPIMYAQTQQMENEFQAKASRGRLKVYNLVICSFMCCSFVFFGFSCTFKSAGGLI